VDDMFTDIVTDDLAITTADILLINEYGSLVGTLVGVIEGDWDCVGSWVGINSKHFPPTNMYGDMQLTLTIIFSL
jgi:hypothetical protein